MTYKKFKNYTLEMLNTEYDTKKSDFETLSKARKSVFVTLADSLKVKISMMDFIDDTLYNWTTKQVKKIEDLISIGKKSLTFTIGELLEVSAKAILKYKQNISSSFISSNVNLTRENSEEKIKKTEYARFFTTFFNEFINKKFWNINNWVFDANGEQYKITNIYNKPSTIQNISKKNPYILFFQNKTIRILEGSLKKHWKIQKMIYNHFNVKEIISFIDEFLIKNQSVQNNKSLNLAQEIEIPFYCSLVVDGDVIYKQLKQDKDLNRWYFFGGAKNTRMLLTSLFLESLSFGDLYQALKKKYLKIAKKWL